MIHITIERAYNTIVDLALRISGGERTLIGNP